MPYLRRVRKVRANNGMQPTRKKPRAADAGRWAAADTILNQMEPITA